MSRWRLGAQALDDHGLLCVEVERLEGADVLHGAEQFAGEGVQQLLAVPGFFVVAEVEDLFDQACGLPPGAEVLQEAGLASATHAAHEHEVTLREQSLLQVQDVEVAAHETVLERSGFVTFGYGSEVFSCLFRGEVAHAQGGWLVLVDDGQQPVFQIDGLVEVGLPPLVVVEFLAGAANGGGEVVPVKKLPVERAHHQFRRADGHGVAHRQRHLHARLHQAAAQARLPDLYLLFLLLLFTLDILPGGLLSCFPSLFSLPCRSSLLRG